MFKVLFSMRCPKKTININSGCCCKQNAIMSVVPHGAFAAKKIRQNEEKKMLMSAASNELAPPKYSSKFMNSIWGMYNRYSVHNLKKVMGENSAMAVKETPQCDPSAIQRSLSSATTLMTGLM